MGVLGEGINEVIATTWFNAAPMGVHFRDGKYHLHLFRGSHTAMNIERWGWVVANITHDPVLYVKTAFEDLPKKSFVEEEVGDLLMHRLPDVEAWIAFDAAVERFAPQALLVSLVPLKEVVVRPEIHPVNRGFGNLIDATVHATRYVINRDPRLKELIDHHTAVVRRCGGSRELEALALLEGYLKE
jgi:uncharacterized protein